MVFFVQFLDAKMMLVMFDISGCILSTCFTSIYAALFFPDSAKMNKVATTDCCGVQSRGSGIGR